MADKYQSSANKSNRKLQVMQARQLAAPLPLVEVWKELQPQVERLTGMAELRIIRAVIGDGKNPSCGLDCSGLVQNVFLADPDNNIATLDKVRSASGQATSLQDQGYYSTDITNAQPGDAIFFADNTGKIAHVGIVVEIKDGKVYFVHSPGRGQKVHKTHIDMKKLRFDSQKFAGIGRPIEPVKSQQSTNKSNLFSNSSRWLSNLVESWFFNQAQQQQQQQEQVTHCILDKDGNCVSQ